jgi:hypothetical protein
MKLNLGIDVIHRLGDSCKKQKIPLQSSSIENSSNMSTGTINIEDLIKQVTSKLNLDEALTRKAIGLVLAFVQKTCSKNNFDFNQILLKLQGADTLVARTNDPLPNQTASVPGLSMDIVGSIFALMTWLLHVGPVVDILKRILSLFFGDKAVQMIDSAGDGTELLGKLSAIGISREQGSKVVAMLVSFMKQHLDPKTIDELLEKIPALKAVVGDTSKKQE